MPSRSVVRSTLAVAALSLLPGCALLDLLEISFDGTGGDLDATEAVYQGAMADFSLCQTVQDPTERAAAVTRMTEAASQMQAETRPTNPDHFYMTDRVLAARDACAGDIDAAAPPIDPASF